jgi:hypothetical protein
MDKETGIVFMAFDIRNENGKINIYNATKHIIASVPISRASIIFSENEIPSMEEVE